MIRVPAALDILLTRLSRRERLARVARGAIVGVLIACPIAIATGAALSIPIAGLLGATIAASLRVRRTELASRVDQIADLRELLATASSISPTTDDPFERVVLTQADARARDVDLRSVGASFPSPRAIGATLLACAASIALMLPLHRSASSSVETASSERLSSTRDPSSPERSPESPASSRSDAERNDATTTQDPRGDNPTRVPDSSRPTSTVDDSANSSPASSDGVGTGVAASDERRSIDRSATASRAQDATIDSTNAAAPTKGNTGSDGTAGAGVDSASSVNSSAAPRSVDPLNVDRVDFLPSASKDAARAALRDGRVPAHARAVVRAYFDLDEGR
jgi:hypothetical protein